MNPLKFQLKELVLMELNKKIKILVVILSLLLIIIFFLAILGFTDIINFWIAVVLVGVFAFFVLPKLNKKINH